MSHFSISAPQAYAASATRAATAFVCCTVLALIGCASTPQQQPAAAVAPAQVPSAPKTLTNLSVANVESAYFLNRGADSGLKSLTLVHDFGQSLFAVGEKSGLIYHFEASTGKLVAEHPAVGSPFGAKSLIRGFSKLFFVLDPSNKRVQIWQRDFSTKAIGDVALTSLINPVAFEISPASIKEKMRLNFIDDRAEGRKLVQIDLIGKRSSELSFEISAFRFDQPRVIDLPATAVAGETAALKVDPINGQIWLASGKSIYVLDENGAATDVPVREFPTPVYGLGVMACKRGEQLGYWLVGTQAPDASKRAPFYLYDRGTSALVGGFDSKSVKNPTDLAFIARNVGLFPNGAVFVATEGTGVAGLDWNKIASSNSLRKVCF